MRFFLINLGAASGLMLGVPVWAQNSEPVLVQSLEPEAECKEGEACGGPDTNGESFDLGRVNLSESDRPERTFTFGVDRSDATPRMDLRIAKGPDRAMQVDEEASMACKLEQARRDRDYIAGEGPICRDVRVAREQREAEEGRLNVDAKAKSADASSVSRDFRSEQSCETTPDGAQRCTSSTRVILGTGERTARELERFLDGDPPN